MGCELNAMQKKSAKGWKKTKYSFSYIYESLSLLGDINVYDEKYKKLIVETIMRLPIHIKEKVLYDLNVTFLIIGKYTCGHTHNFYSVKSPHIKEMTTPVIVLNFLLMNKDRMSEQSIMNIVAHEIAHIILRHTGGHTDPKAEQKANDLAVKWGFGRL